MSDKIFLEKVTGAAIPADEDSQQIFNTFTIGRKFEVLPWTERNYGFHQKMISLINLVIHNSKKWEGMEWRELLGIIQLDINHVDECLDFQGNLQRWPKSIAFRNMSEIAFTKLFNRVHQYMLTNLERLIPGMPPDRFNMFVDRILNYS